MMVARKPGHQGERGISRKTIAQGMPGVSGVPAVTNACAFYHCARGCGCFGRPAFPVPSVLSRAEIPAQLGRATPRDRGDVFKSAISLKSEIKMRPVTLELAAKFVMPGLVPGIHVLAAVKQERRGWPGIGERKRRRPSDGYARP